MQHITTHTDGTKTAVRQKGKTQRCVRTHLREHTSSCAHSYTRIYTCTCTHVCATYVEHLDCTIQTAYQVLRLLLAQLGIWPKSNFTKFNLHGLRHLQQHKGTEGQHNAWPISSRLGRRAAKGQHKHWLKAVPRSWKLANLNDGLHPHAFMLSVLTHSKPQTCALGEKQNWAKECAACLAAAGLVSSTLSTCNSTADSQQKCAGGPRGVDNCLARVKAGVRRQ